MESLLTGKDAVLHSSQLFPVHTVAFIELIALRTPLVILSSTCDTLVATHP